jgi:hypothetical protein
MKLSESHPMDIDYPMLIYATEHCANTQLTFCLFVILSLALVFADENEVHLTRVPGRGRVSEFTKTDLAVLRIVDINYLCMHGHGQLNEWHSSPTIAPALF